MRKEVRAVNLSKCLDSEWSLGWLSSSPELSAAIRLQNECHGLRFQEAPGYFIFLDFFSPRSRSQVFLIMQSFRDETQKNVECEIFRSTGGSVFSHPDFQKMGKVEPDYLGQSNHKPASLAI